MSITTQGWGSGLISVQGWGGGIDVPLIPPGLLPRIADSLDLVPELVESGLRDAPPSEYSLALKPSLTGSQAQEPQITDSAGLAPPPTITAALQLRPSLAGSATPALPQLSASPTYAGPALVESLDLRPEVADSQDAGEKPTLADSLALKPKLTKD